MRISKMVEDAHQIAREKGWHDEDRTFGEVIALIHSELSEALEDYRKGCDLTKVWYEKKSDVDGILYQAGHQATPEYKPCGIPSELADVVIRVADACGKYGIDLESVIRQKMEYNKRRSYKHGGKRI